MIEGISLISAPIVWVKPDEGEMQQAIAQFTDNMDDGVVSDRTEYDSDDFEAVF